MTLRLRRAAALLAASVATNVVVAAETERFSDWLVGPFTNGVYAATSNESGSFLAQYCYFHDGSCDYRIVFSKQCEDGSTYPGLISSEIGASHVTFTCRGRLPDKAKWIYVLSQFDLVDSTVRGAVRMSFAIPLDSDGFHVVRFSLRGAVPAIRFMQEVREVGARLNSAPAGTKDTTL